MRFSIQIPLADDGASWRDKVARAEDLGFYSVSVPDHLGPMLPQLAPMVALAAAATYSERLRLAVTVLDNDFRHPVIVAKEAATLDVLSGGRVDLGLGAGWLEEDYTKTGIASWDPPRTRVDRLLESVELLCALWGGESVTFKGHFYEVTDFVSFPRPVQAPLPIMIGGRNRRMLSAGARLAQVLSILPATTPGGATEAGLVEQLRWIDEAGGRARGDLVVGLRIPFGLVASPTQSGHEAAEEFAGRMQMSADEAVASPFALVGDLSMIRDQLTEAQERHGIGYVTVSEDLGWAIAPLVQDLGD